MDTKPHVLVVCGRNKRRSRTAEYIFKNDMRFIIRSVGLSPRSERQLREEDLSWADLVLVMEQKQRSRITEAYRQLELPSIEVLYIPDEYEYLDEELIELLTDKINACLQSAYGI
ncbi:protein-tyrosine-phosphatase [Rhodocytophaga rosea]|uniref:Protein-tyrosine-phosphatase n=1 Tax=Rhodocytophaga rosea TaxID=2704465 RepID=A0A6C0GJH0_9BACT|nr:protein-tyrosine-phosphatase [Rhodocytophaga rosea]QHT67780.1 protein-tyrosine-phosphatase [Rhodocytophaga rosea]